MTAATDFTDALDHIMSFDAPAPFEIVDADAADRILYVVAELRREVREIDELAADRRRKIDDAHEAATKPRTEKLTVFVGALERYMASKRTKHTKSILLPNGRLWSRHVQPKVEFVDKDAYITWATVNAPSTLKAPDAMISVVRKAVTQTPDAAVTEDGEVVPGLTVTPESYSYGVDA